MGEQPKTLLDLFKQTVIAWAKVLGGGIVDWVKAPRSEIVSKFLKNAIAGMLLQLAVALAMWVVFSCSYELPWGLTTYLGEKLCLWYPYHIMGPGFILMPEYHLYGLEDVNAVMIGRYGLVLLTWAMLNVFLSGKWGRRGSVLLLILIVAVRIFPWVMYIWYASAYPLGHSYNLSQACV